jgi:REP element-mobilizing transposase RayT
MGLKNQTPTSKNYMNKIFDKEYNPVKYHRRSIRLKEYDYSSPGAYFVTICTQRGENIFGKISHRKINLGKFGKIVKSTWLDLPKHYPNIRIDVFSIMPNHFHGILFLDVGARFIVPKIKEKLGFDKSNPYIKNNPMVSDRTTLGKIIRFFKAKTTYQIRNLTNLHYFQWQRSYYEHVIRNEEKLNLIRQYILYNPLQWQYDQENPEHIQDKGYQEEWGDFERLIFGKSIMQQARMLVVPKGKSDILV